MVGINLYVSEYSSSVTIWNPAGVSIELERVLRRQRASLEKNISRKRGRGLLLIAEIADELRSIGGGEGVKAVVYQTPVEFAISTAGDDITVVDVISGVENPSFNRRLTAIASQHLDRHLLLDFTRTKTIGTAGVSVTIQISELFESHGKKVVAVGPEMLWVHGALQARTREGAIALLRRDR